MRTFLLATTALVTLSPITKTSAETVIDTKVTNSVRTSTVKAGAADSVRVSEKGTINPASGTAVTIDSNNHVTNAGTIQITNADNATGILANVGAAGDIANSGKIIIDETYVATDTDKDGDLDGPFSQGAGRTGIRSVGAFFGSVANSGEVTVKGNDSAGIWLGGKLTGAFTHDGKTNVTGDRSTGIRLSDVAGNVTVGAVAANGKDAVGVRFDGDVAGAVVL